MCICFHEGAAESDAYFASKQTHSLQLPVIRSVFLFCIKPPVKLFSEGVDKEPVLTCCSSKNQTGLFTEEPEDSLLQHHERRTHPAECKPGQSGDLCCYDVGRHTRAATCRAVKMISSSVNTMCSLMTPITKSLEANLIVPATSGGARCWKGRRTNTKPLLL